MANQDLIEGLHQPVMHFGQVAVQANLFNAYFSGLLWDIRKLAFETAHHFSDMNAPIWADQPFIQAETDLPICWIQRGHTFMRTPGDSIWVRFDHEMGDI